MSKLKLLKEIENLVGKKVIINNDAEEVLSLSLTLCGLYQFTTKNHAFTVHDVLEVENNRIDLKFE